jgi:serine/threonine-protein kinase
VATFFKKHHTGLVTLIFTVLVDSSILLTRLGDQAGASFLQQRRKVIRDTLRTLPESEEIETAGDSFLLAFNKLSDAVRFALQTQARLRQFSHEADLPVQERIGIHLGEVVIAEHETEAKAKDLYGIQLTTCARVMSLAEGGQILLTRGVFDSARQVLKGEDIEGVGPLSWVSHGAYLLKGIEEAVEVCEVSEVGQRAPLAPKTSEKAQRQVRAGEEPVMGWRPAVGQVVPNTKWELEQKLGEGGFGEVWVGRHQTLKTDQRVFKFCFQADRIRSLKREVTLFRLLKERTGEQPHVVRLYEVYFDQPPFYLEEEYVPGKDLKSWCEGQGGVHKVPLSTRLEIVAQAAEALQAAHDAGIIHRDIKPGNILVAGELSGTRHVTVKLSDFGIGQVVSQDYLSGVTKAGFTMTLLGPESSSQTGTHLYMAPELLAGKPASTRSDIYSLGVVLFQFLAADFRRPVTTDWANAVTDPLLRDDLKVCFAGNPEYRFTGAAQLATNLRNWEKRRQEAARLEQLRRNAKRRAKLLMASGVVALSMIVFAAALGYGMQKARIERDKQRRLSYATDMSVAHQALADSNLKYATELLDRQKPRPGQDDLRGWEWRYLWQQCKPGDLIHYVGGGSGCAAFSPDGQWAAYNLGSQVVIRDTHSGAIVTNLPGSATTLSFSSRAPLLAVPAETNVTLWNTSLRQPVRRLPGGLVAKFSPDGRWLVTMRTNHFILWDTATWEIKATCPGETRVGWFARNVVAFSHSSNYLVTLLSVANEEVDVFRVWKLPNLEARAGFHGFRGGSERGRVLC